MMTFDFLKNNRDLILLECISGSKAYGLNTPESDTDIKGVFILPKNIYYGLNYTPQVNDDTNDTTYYELGRFIELLYVNNPNILELLNTPQDSILFKHPILDNIKSELFLSKLCENTFGRFALSQVKKARGLKKKIVNPISKERKNVLNFCYVNYDNGSIPLFKFLELKGWSQENCGLVNIPHMKDVYGLYYSENDIFKGIIKNDKSNDVVLSSIPKESKQVGLLYFNKNGYSTYCKEYREYWDWVEKRNDVRYENTKSHGKNYDAKNMMHVFRLLEMGIEIGRDHNLNVRRTDKDFLLKIKSGAYSYNELLSMADSKQKEMENVFIKTKLQGKPDFNKVNHLLYDLRNYFYKYR